MYVILGHEDCLFMTKTVFLFQMWDLTTALDLMDKAKDGEYERTRFCPTYSDDLKPYMTTLQSQCKHGWTDILFLPLDSFSLMQKMV